MYLLIDACTERWLWFGQEVLEYLCYRHYIKLRSNIRPYYVGDIGHHELRMLIMQKG